MGSRPSPGNQPDGRRQSGHARMRGTGTPWRRSWLALAAVSGGVGLVAAGGLLSRDGTDDRAGDGAAGGDPAGLAAAAPTGPGGEASPDATAMSPEPGVLRFGPAGDGLAIPLAGGEPDGTAPGVDGAAAARPNRPAAGLAPAQYPRAWHEFYFTRAAYSSWRGGWGGRSQSWAIDYPKSDRQFVTVLKRLTNLDAYDDENAVLLTDPNIRRFPFLYALEVGYMDMSPPEIEGLRDYLYAGGFLVIDDFWGTQEWSNFEYQMGLVFPGRPIIDLELDHPVFNTFYEIEEILQVPAYGRFWGGRTSERDGFVPYVKGIQDDDGRLMVIINWNTDLGDAWEWAEQPDYPLQYSTFAFQMGVNMIVYAMSH